MKGETGKKREEVRGEIEKGEEVRGEIEKKERRLERGDRNKERK